MGMRSYCTGQDLKEYDREKIKSLLLLEKIQDRPLEFDNLIDENGEIDFFNWSDFKLDGYWYQETRDVLWLLASFIEGEVEFNCDEGYNYKIIFEGGNVFYSKGEIVYTDKEILGKKEE